MSDLMRVFSPAKINLFLAVTGRRSDSFHEIVSIVAKLDFGDALIISMKKGGGEDDLQCDMAGLDCGPDNLIRRAATSFREATGLKFTVAVRLEKQIPLGAGLGGGSSNAAACLRALNEMCGAPLRFEDLNHLGASLGSDVPLFLWPGPVLVRGRGEVVEALSANVKKLISKHRVFLFAPQYPISTKWAYGKFAERVGNYAAKELVELALGKWSRKEGEWNDWLYNSFETVIREKFIDLDEVMREVEGKFGVPCLLSGSGSASFAFYDDEALAAGIRAYVEDAFGKEAFMVACKFESLSDQRSL